VEGGIKGCNSRTFENKKFERVGNFKYLGVILNEDSNYQMDFNKE
jgi:hypothetical protein